MARSESSCACSTCRRLRSVFSSVLVVGHFEHDGGDDLAECDAKLGGGRVRVLDRVVQERSAEDVDIVDTLALEQARERDRVVDVGRGLGILAALIAVLVGREGDGVEQQRLGVEVHGGKRRFG